MSAKIVVLYPQPSDAQAFEHTYHGEHMPLMHTLVQPASRVPTFRVRAPQPAPFYRMAEIHFPSLAELYAFSNNEQVESARRSSERVSTGGKPLVLVCESD